MPFLISPIRFMLHYVAARPWIFLLLGVLVAGASVSSIGVQYAMKLLIDAMTGTDRLRSHVYAMLAVFLGFVLLESLLQRAAALTLGHATVVSGVGIRLDMVDYLTGHQMPFFQNQRAGSLGHRISGLAGIFGAIVHRLLQEVTPPLIAFAGAIIIFLTIDVRMALVLGAIFIVVTVALVLLGLRGHVHHKAFAETAGTVGGELVDLIGNIWVVKAFAARQRELSRLESFLDDEATAQRRGWFFVEQIRGLHDLVLAVLVGGTLIWAIGRWSTGAISTGDVVVISTMTFRILHGSRDLAMALIDTSQQFSYLRETLDIIGVPQTLSDTPDAARLSVGEGRVELSHVTFGYDPRHPILHDLSLEVPAGQKVGIVGPSGAGKSSLLQLIQRFHDPQVGSVSIDGQRIDRVTQESLRDALAVVPQEVLLFHRSVMENIRFAKPDASDEDVHRAAEAAGCDDFIRRLPHGYDSIVGERGTNLSGGQRQRIGIARAFLKNARIVLLDEATSALDSESELEVQNGLEALIENRTVIAVAHRLSTIAHFDRVVVIDQGRVVEDGPPQQLLRNRGGAFRQLWVMQVEGLDRASNISLAGERLRSMSERSREQLQRMVRRAWPGATDRA
ncbi:MAG: ABC transporter ATP-binding protein [Sphingomonas sp.]|uniref:ABC transporter ATP-binding protein n=2 Tax=Sphingomonadaceae TaxID=41297 RepID=A0A2A4I6Z3_9SPHN|nr:ABC transporter ATP-binding protein [Sphingomonas adhaesiva]PCG13956.1 ABC transporter ATP-binding protein [Sphingomonas adhaesiva]PZU76847.1 MAG: ABC transporter ATP-binding protein [Sphingomonas sp.]